jgi:hypothetical protein
MDQCSKHDTPPAFSVDLASRTGHTLQLELNTQICLVLTVRRLGDSIALKSEAVQTH